MNDKTSAGSSKTRHERRVVGHASGWQEQMNTCVCGNPWPCPEVDQTATIERLTAERDEWKKAFQQEVARLQTDIQELTCGDPRLVSSSSETCVVHPAAQVTGNFIQTTLAQFYTRGQYLLVEEQEKASPDNALVAFICDAIRLGRENERLVGMSPEADEPTVDQIRREYYRQGPFSARFVDWMGDAQKAGEGQP